MGRAPCCSKVGLHRGPWTPREDTLLTKYIQTHGEGNWRSLPKKAGLLRCGKSCRLRWMNYLRPDIKRGNITPDEDDLIIRLHSLLGNRWSLIAGRLPGRTDNEIKNYWNTHLSKRLISEGTDPSTHKKLSQPILKTKNKRSSTTTKKKNNKSTKSKIVPEKTKVHLPKPTRITSLSMPRNDSFNSTTTINSTTLSSSNCEEEGLGLAAAICDQNCEDNGIDFLVAVNQYGAEGSELPDYSLEKLYEEYYQLLRTSNVDDQLHLDSFTESLLV
ncbi:hypothetical protein ACFE04_018849 [Oxalis oulophora]